jgi:hypothetical protein
MIAIVGRQKHQDDSKVLSAPKCANNKKDVNKNREHKQKLGSQQHQEGQQHQGGQQQQEDRNNTVPYVQRRQ